MSASETGASRVDGAKRPRHSGATGDRGRRGHRPRLSRLSAQRLCAACADHRPLLYDPRGELEPARGLHRPILALAQQSFNRRSGPAPRGLVDDLRSMASRPSPASPAASSRSRRRSASSLGRLVPCACAPSISPSPPGPSPRRCISSSPPLIRSRAASSALSVPAPRRRPDAARLLHHLRAGDARLRHRHDLPPLLRSRLGIFIRTPSAMTSCALESLGIDATPQSRSLVFTASSALAGLAGASSTPIMRVVVLSPQIADFSEMAKLGSIMTGGGRGSVPSRGR